MIARAFDMARQLRHERYNAEHVARLQNDGFLRLFRHAYLNIPFYHDLYRSKGITPADIRSLADIVKLPIVSKTQLRDASLNGQLWQNTDHHRMVLTSGSSGMPFKFYVNARDNEWRKAQYLLPYVSTGRKPWHSLLRFRGNPAAFRSLPDRLGVFKETSMLAAIPVAEQYRKLETLQPDYIQGYPCMLRLLAKHILDNGLSCPVLKKVYTDSELLYPDTRAMLEIAFKAEVIDIFGSYETDNIGYECNEHNGYHLLESSVIVETTPPRVGQFTKNTGELVCTVLHNSVTPFIRYNLADLVEISADPCSCGRTSRRLSVLHGRSNDLLTMPDGSKRESLHFVLFCNKWFLNKVKEFQIHQLYANRIEIRVVADKPLAPGDVTAFNTDLASVLPFTSASIAAVDTIARTDAGKYKAFIGLENSAPDVQ